MKWKIFWWAFFMWILCANSTAASVRINEIAWMGTADSSRGEWIELANDLGTSVDLSGWSIEAEDGSPQIALTQVIGAEGYFLIERTSDATVPNVQADLVLPFGNGLSNSGETLHLKNASGVIVDTVVGGANWAGIGGSNTTKQTPQRLPDISNGWITGVPTPRATNVLKSTAPTAMLKTLASPAQKNSGAEEIKTAAPVFAKTRDATSTILWKHDNASSGEDDFFIRGNMKWLLVFVTALLTLFAGFIIVRSDKKEELSSVDEYTIIESTDDE